MPDHDLRLQEWLPNRDVCPHILQSRPCCLWAPGTACSARWHPEFLQVLEDGASKWIWVPRQIICRTHQRSLGIRQHGHRYTCTNPNCVRPHAPNWLYAELLAFRWYVQHEIYTGLGTGFTLDGDLIAMSYRTASLTLATMPYIDEEFYHQHRWHSPIPQPEAYGQMLVTATSYRANLNEQPRRRATTPRRHSSPRRQVSPPRHRGPPNRAVSCFLG